MGGHRTSDTEAALDGKVLGGAVGDVGASAHHCASLVILHSVSHAPLPPIYRRCVGAPR